MRLYLEGWGWGLGLDCLARRRPLPGEGLDGLVGLLRTLLGLLHSEEGDFIRLLDDGVEGVHPLLPVRVAPVPCAWAVSVNGSSEQKGVLVEAFSGLVYVTVFESQEILARRLQRPSQLLQGLRG